MKATKRKPPQRTTTIRCAIYTRKSNDEGLDQDFNSLDAQRESGESFIASHKSEGWVALPERYDDGGYSGGTTDRPALLRLLEDVEGGKVDRIVVYKLDRLSRSILDFLQIAEMLDERGVAITSVTQSFDTRTSIGRLFLNILMSFAQFEREIAGERIRDKIAAAKKKGKHTGGTPILGYDVKDGRLVINEDEARLVHQIFTRFTKLGSMMKLVRELNAKGHTTKRWTTRKGVVAGGKTWNKGHLYKLLRNRKYIGEVEHKGDVYKGEHKAIVPRKLWDAVHGIFGENGHVRGNLSRSESPALLRGIVRCGHCDAAMGTTSTKQRGRLYRYYVCGSARRRGHDTCPVRTVAAGTIEDAVVGQLRTVFRTPELVARTFREARAQHADEIERLRVERNDLEKNLRGLKKDADRLLKANGNGTGSLAEELRRTGDEIEGVQARLDAVSADLKALEDDVVGESEVIDTLSAVDPMWDELFPGEQARIVQLLVERVDVSQDGLELRLRADGLRSLVAEIAAGGADDETEEAS